MSITRGSRPRTVPGIHRLVAPAVRAAALMCTLLGGIVARGHAAPGEMDDTFAGFSGGLAMAGANVMCHAVAPDGKHCG